MPSINTQTGMFYPSDSAAISPDFASNITQLFGGTSIASITLTVFNFVTAGVAIVLILLDNRRIHKTWKIAPSNRIPLALAVAICLSHVFFVIKSFIGLAAFHTFNPPKNDRLACRIFSELGFWAIWAPLVTIVVRIIVTVASISFRFDTYATWVEGITIFLTAVVSFVVYIPVRIIAPAHRCVPFVLAFLGPDQPKLATAGTIILSMLLLLLTIGMLIVGFDSGMLKRNVSKGDDLDSPGKYIQAQQRLNPDRKLVYYGAALFLQFVCLLPNFILGGMGALNLPLNFLASVALHIDGTVLLLQYIFGHRKNSDPCPHCSSPWHPDDDRDQFHRPYSARVGQWWRRTFIESQYFITPSRSLPVPTTPGATSKFSTEETEVSSINVRRIAGQSVQRPSVRQIEIPSPVFLPRLTFLSTKTGDMSATEGSGQSKFNMSRTPRSTFQSFLGKSKLSQVSTPPTREALEIGYPRISVVHRFTPSVQAIPVAKDAFNKRDTPPILRNHDSFQSSPPSNIFETPLSSKPGSRTSSLRPSRLGNASISSLPRSKPPQTEGKMLPSRPAPTPKPLENASGGSLGNRQTNTGRYYI